MKSTLITMTLCDSMCVCECLYLFVCLSVYVLQATHMRRVLCRDEISAVRNFSSHTDRQTQSIFDLSLERVTAPDTHNSSIAAIVIIIMIIIIIIIITISADLYEHFLKIHAVRHSSNPKEVRRILLSSGLIWYLDDG